jgi:uncharacterized protein DUF4307
MVAVQSEPPKGRYGRSSDERADRRLKTVGAVLGVLLLGFVGWVGVSYLSSQAVTGTLIKYKVVSDHEAQAHLEVRKDAGARGVCTLRALDHDHAEVGRKDTRIGGGSEQVDTVVSIRTTQRAYAVELVGCQSAAKG